jgi:hypothetical protein
LCKNKGSYSEQEEPEEQGVGWLESFCMWISCLGVTEILALPLTQDDFDAFLDHRKLVKLEHTIKIQCVNNGVMET